jgi:hypothetical protein
MSMPIGWRRRACRCRTGTPFPDAASRTRRRNFNKPQSLNNPHQFVSFLIMAAIFPSQQSATGNRESSAGLKNQNCFKGSETMNANSTTGDRHASDNTDIATAAPLALDIDTLYRTHKQHLLRFVQRYVRNTDDAEDVVQNTFIEALRGSR